MEIVIEEDRQKIKDIKKYYNLFSGKMVELAVRRSAAMVSLPGQSVKPIV